MIQWRSQGLPGWARAKMRTTIRKIWENIRIIDRNLRKNEESGTLTHPGLWGWLRPWYDLSILWLQMWLQVNEGRIKMHHWTSFKEYESNLWILLITAKWSIVTMPDLWFALSYCIYMRWYRRQIPCGIYACWHLPKTLIHYSKC